jgi:hypothetical protein
MLLAALNCPGLHPGYSTSRHQSLLDPDLRSAFRKVDAPHLRIQSCVARMQSVAYIESFRVVVG